MNKYGGVHSQKISLDNDVNATKPALSQTSIKADQKKIRSPSELDRIVQAELHDSERMIINNQNDIMKNKSSQDVTHFEDDGDIQHNNPIKTRNSSLHQRQLPYFNIKPNISKAEKKDHNSAKNLSATSKMT